jgi:hypothetical protein
MNKKYGPFRIDTNNIVSSSFYTYTPKYIELRYTNKRRQCYYPLEYCCTNTINKKFSTRLLVLSKTTRDKIVHIHYYRRQAIDIKREIRLTNIMKLTLNILLTKNCITTNISLIKLLLPWRVVIKNITCRRVDIKTARSIKCVS